MELEKMTSADLFAMSEFCKWKISNLSMINQDDDLTNEIDKYRDCRLICEFELEKRIQPIIDAHIKRRIDESK